TTYEPVAPGVRVGDTVGAGSVLGRLALAGSHCFPVTCLHWGLIAGSDVGDRYLDPLTLVGGGPVRLLPLDGGPLARTPLFVGLSPLGSVRPGEVGPVPGTVVDRPVAVPEPPVRPADPGGRAALFRA
ncbi:MAG: hypothetical protein ACXVFU_12985, partial [Nocardioidaceae bacterium]